MRLLSGKLSRSGSRASRLGLELSDGFEAESKNLVVFELDLNELSCFRVHVGQEIENSLKFSMRSSSAS